MKSLAVKSKKKLAAGQVSGNGIENGKIVKLMPYSMIDTPVMNYQRWLDNSPGKLADLSGVDKNQRIVIIGGGMGGLITGFELLRAGFTNFKIYEATNRIGGRFYSYEFPQDQTNFAELGAMRFPPTENCLYWYIKYLQDHESSHGHKITMRADFPDPGLVPTLVMYKGQQYNIMPGQPVPDIFRDINESWTGFVTTTDPIILPGGITLDPPASISAWLNTSNPSTYNPTKAQNAWQGYVNYFKDKSFIEGVIDIFCQPNAPKKYNALTGKWGDRYQWSYPDDIEKFGTVGTGIGGQSPLFPISFICMLRFTLNKLEDEHALIVTGTDSVANGIADFNINGKKLRDFIATDTPVRTVTPVSKGGKITLADKSGKVIETDVTHLVIATTHRASEIELDIDSLWQASVPEAPLVISQDKRQALTSMHIAQSSKFFLKVKPWWLGDKDRVRCITTDTAMANFYTLDYSDKDSEAICLMNYVWEDLSEKAEALGEINERYQRFLADLAQIKNIDYILEAMPKQVDNTNAVMIDWQMQKFYNGAFALTQPTQEDYLSRMYYNFMNMNKGVSQVYFVGDSYSWIGGWVDGALETGLNTFSAIVKNLNGTFTNAADNPLNNLNSKSIIYDNPSSIGPVASFGPYGGHSVGTTYFNNKTDTSSKVTLYYDANSKNPVLNGININGQSYGSTGSSLKAVPLDLKTPVRSIGVYVCSFLETDRVRCIRINDTIYGGAPQKDDQLYSMPLNGDFKITAIMGLFGHDIDRIGFSLSVIV